MRKYSKCKLCSKTIDVTHQDADLCKKCEEKEEKEMENWTKQDWLKAFAETRWTLYRPLESLDCPNSCEVPAFQYNVFFTLDEYGIEKDAEDIEGPICLECGEEAIVDQY